MEAQEIEDTGRGGYSDTKGHFYLITTYKVVNWQEYLGNDYEQAIKIVREREDRDKSTYPNGIYSYRIVRFDEKLEPLPFDGLSEKFFRIDQLRFR